LPEHLVAPGAHTPLHAPVTHAWFEQAGPQLGTVRATPHESVPVAFPHVYPRRLQSCASVSGTQAQAPLALHVAGAVHDPQLLTVRDTPQRSRVVSPPHVRL
jgi:hypothetical protein